MTVKWLRRIIGKNKKNISALRQSAYLKENITISFPSAPYKRKKLKEKSISNIWQNADAHLFWTYMFISKS